ncbi:hypothetical protein DFP72DRAFT_1060780 [Ephemerocybe angulata]|uniref:Uncharacterized protein n=1 Tax=Ephemerocybe angulata TaxID=980116 RepID=A0A8H6ME66_9AGAR|nr:hypothetical protein DFP72DRAFT_1060780 [Tulosesus angulatus]
MVDWEFEHEVEEDDGDELWEDLDEDESDREGDDVLLNSVDLLPHEVELELPASYGELSTSLGLPSTTTPVDEQPSHSPTTPRNLKQARTWDTPKEASQDTTLDTTELPNDATPGPTDTQLPEDLEYLRLKKRRQTRALSPETNVHVEESFPGQLFTPIQSCYFGPAPDCQVEGGDGNDLLELASQQDSDWSYEHGTPTMHSEAPSEAQAADSELSLASDASDASSLPPANLTVMTTSGDQPHYETSLESTAALLLVQGEQLLNLALQHFASTIQFINRLRNEPLSKPVLPRSPEF